jgi:hypothetical protein
MAKNSEEQKRKKRDYVLRGRLEAQIDLGKTLPEAARLLGISKKHAQRLAKMKRQKPRRDSLNVDLWLEFLDGYLSERESTMLCNGQPVKDKHVRALYRWRMEGSCPRFFAADDFLIQYGLHINDFINHCDERGISPWACGRAPDWEEGHLVDA